VSRRITSLRVRVRRGNSGGPVLDSTGRVVGTVFAARIDGEAGYAVPPDVTDDALARSRSGPVSTGDCVR
jgi:S1-C subfamily serine protease